MVENHAQAFGGAICMWNSDLLIINNTIANNNAGAGGGYSSEYSNPRIVNSIFWNDSANVGNEIHIENDPDPLIEHCDVKGGWWGDGNIDTDPHFRDPESGNYHLMSTACGDPFDSPCIDAGDPSIFDYYLDCDWGLGSERSDMGAYGGAAIPTDIREEDRESELPLRLCLSQNYPNPFNASTKISFSLPEAQAITIAIFDLLGREVVLLHDGYIQAGIHQVNFDASDLTSGIYFSRIQSSKSVQTIKMTLLK